MSEKELIWTVKLDWLNVLRKIGLDSINEIPEYKRIKAIKNITRIHGTENLLSFKPNELEQIVANEIKDLMKKELNLKRRKEDKVQEQMSNNMVPLKDGGIIRINLNDLKDLKDLNLDGNPEDIIKQFYKKFVDNEDDDKDSDDKDSDDKEKVKEDNTGYYI
ncbi:MAG: hypothetical protein KGD63_12995 [Candidatus Lokiarchaeota archaeon]|nr:hypothetical protein [Candidatus Lokiarchaeota archaeon]